MAAIRSAQDRFSPAAIDLPVETELGLRATASEGRE